MAATLQLPRRARLVRGLAGGGRWEIATREPSAPLRSYVHGDYVGYSERTPAPSRRREFAVPFVVAILELGPPLRVHNSGDESRFWQHRGGFVAGIGENYADCVHDGFQQGVQLNLTPMGARLLLGVPLCELSGRIVSVYDLLPARYRRLGDRLQELPDWDARFDLLDAVLVERAAQARGRSDVVAWAVRWIAERDGVVDVRSLTRQLGYSHKHVIDLFRDQVGVPPKLFSRIVRFDALLQHLRRRGPATWAELALEFGYYDQAHLVREVKRFTGATPTALSPLVEDVYALLK